MAVYHQSLLDQARCMVPPLSGDNYKGQHGKVGIVGGCREYTGAPYFAAESATKMGSDLNYVICTPSAAPVIKGYSPELIVLPLLPEHDPFHLQQVPPEVVDKAVAALQPWVKRLTCLVVGPGLGDDELAVATSEALIRAAREAGIPLLVDGSGINIITRTPSLVQGYQKCVLTPNIAELGRLAQAVGVKLEGGIGNQWQQHAQEVAAAYGGPLLISKGPTDIITDGQCSITCSVTAALKRCGGQGDVLAGVVATLMSWSNKSARASPPGDGIPDHPFTVAAYAGCSLMRAASFQAFHVAERAMVAGDVVRSVRPAFKQVFEGHV
eukprot:CAMPEP_0202906992 /NCGR_PEP_ID=MMETSP1392-20130828/40940_1 /ASSEMBLY_ACC=CAM_ASM_000868 /TAXON_ID=225041 /ORGANISM="Chlamydomonas chlamydogama, Strain SAG 11-48b" /LENGTH=324 /DNA_ID=CAMNT_0049595709 /DNA_START=146 /DNA_END=1120 /DNA_ORIENTATION=+